MPVSSDLVQISIAREAAYGVPSTTPADWYELPIVNEGIAANVATTLSALIDPTRQVKDSILQNITAEGSIDSELVICPALEILLESAMSKLKTNATGANSPVVAEDPANMQQLLVSDSQLSFTIQKRFPDPVNDGDFLYQVITGCVANTFSVTTSPSEAVTWNTGLMGKEFIEGVTGETGLGEAANISVPVATATPTPVTDPVVLRAAEAVNLEFGIAPFNGDTISTRCFGAFAFNINNNYRGIQCIGTLGNKNVAIGRCEVDLSATVHLRDNKILETLLAQSEHSLNFRVQNPKTAGVGASFEGMFAAFFPRMKIASDSVVAGGTGTDVVNEMTMNALYDSTSLTTLTLLWGDGAVEV